jgi:hypothetical protein
MYKRPIALAALAALMLVLVYAIPASTQSPSLLFGSNSGVAKAVSVTSGGFINVAVTGGGSSVAFQAPTSTCSTPGYAFAANTNYGLNLSGTTLQLCIGGAANFQFAGSSASFNDTTLIFQAGGVNKLSLQKNGSTDGQGLLVNGNGTAGIGFDVATDGTYKLLTRAMANTATLSTGVVTTSGALIAGTSVNANAGSGFVLTSNASISASAAKLIQFTEAAGTTGTEINGGLASLGTCTGGTIVSGSHNTVGSYTGNTSGSCIVNFGTPSFTNAPFCFAHSRASTTHPRISAVAANSITITGGVSGEQIDYFCMGRIGTT